MKTLLSINNFSVAFSTLDGTINAIENVSIQIDKGEVVAIVGESGSGKSVTSMSILQLHPTNITKYTSGEILFTPNSGHTTDLLKATTTTLQQIRGNDIAMIFQEPMTSLNPVMRCGEQLAEILVQHKKITPTNAKQQCIALFEAVQLPNPNVCYKKYPHELSGGQKQRVMIAMAMCCQPQLLICDEPTTALDVTVQKNILQLIKKLQLDNNMSVLFISHDLGLVKSIADKIVVMYKGKIVEQGTANQVLEMPSHPYTKALLACRPTLYPKGQRLPVVNDFMNAQLTTALPIPIKQKEVTTKETDSHKKELLTLENISVDFPIKKNIWGKPVTSFTAVNSVSLAIYEGEMLGLVGESGCGKTTLGRTLLQLQQPTSGTILYKGKNLNSWSKQTLTNDIQIIFQDPYSSLNPRLTIGNAIAEPLLVNKAYTKNAAKDAVIDLLEKVELKPEHFKRYPHEFSGGQRQRIVIARALAMQPKFIVCDESVSALDVSVQAQILNLLNDLKKQFSFTGLFISHDLSVVRYISDRIAVMQKGEIVELDSAEKVFYKPQHPYTKKLIESIPN